MDTQLLSSEVTWQPFFVKQEWFLKFNGVINESVAPDGSANIMTVFKQVSQIFPLSEMLLFINFLVCKIYYYHFFITADGGLFTMVSAC